MTENPLIIPFKELHEKHLTSNTIFARKCETKEVETSAAHKFFSENHLYGTSHLDYSIGLYHHNNLVAVMAFRSIKEGEYYLTRLCYEKSTNIPGGGTKLFNFFSKKFNPGKVSTWCRKTGNGSIYLKMGFVLEGSKKGVKKFIWQKF